MKNISRRIFTENMIGSLFTLTLVESLCKSEVLAKPIDRIANKWLIELEAISKDLISSKIQPIEWQRNIENILAQIELSDLLKAIDYQKLAKSVKFSGNHEYVTGVHFKDTKGLTDELSFDPYFYALKKDQAIVPHGHHNMVSMHMILDGQAHAKQYDRIADEPGYLIIKPTIDKIFDRKNLSTISDQKDNIHWFKAITGTVFMFNVGIFGINSGEQTTGRDYVDPDRGEKLPDGTIRARRLDHKEAYKLYSI